MKQFDKQRIANAIWVLEQYSYELNDIREAHNESEEYTMHRYQLDDAISVMCDIRRFLEKEE